LLIVFSPAADASRDVLKEITLAHEQKKKLLPVRICPCTPSNNTRYPLAGVQWFDALENLNGCADSLVKAVRGAGKLTLLGDTAGFLSPEVLHRLLHRWLPILSAAVVTTLLVQTLFYTTGTPVLTGASLWFVFFVSVGLALAVRGIWKGSKK
jgi:hypothetical protein